MATRNNVQATKTLDINDDDVDAIPEEHIVNDISNTVSALSVEALNDLTPSNRQRDELERQKLTHPVGDWVKVDRWEQHDPRIFTEDSQPGDINPAGRTMLSFSGKCQPRVVNGIEHDPMFFLRISPDLRQNQNNDKVPDMAYKLWLRVEELYLTLYGAQWETGRQLFTMLTEDTFIIRTMKGDNKPIVDIKAVVKRR